MDWAIVLFFGKQGQVYSHDLGKMHEQSMQAGISFFFFPAEPGRDLSGLPLREQGLKEKIHACSGSCMLAVT